MVSPIDFAQTPAPPQGENATKKLIDAGHGGADTGLNADGIAENALDLPLALKVRAELEKQREVS